MLWIVTLFVMVAVAYAMLNEGILNAICVLVNVILAGLVAFMLFEPIADELGKMIAGTALDQTEDALTLFGLFAAVYGGLRLLTATLAPVELELPARVQQVASGVVGLAGGYLLSGFLVVMVSTLPLSEKFMGYEAGVENVEAPLRRYVPADRVWLSLMHHASKASGLGAGETTFDPEGSFALRYAKKRRVPEQTIPGVN